MTRPIILAAALVAYLLFLFDIAWPRFPATNPRPNWIPFHSIIGGMADGDSWSTRPRKIIRHVHHPEGNLCRRCGSALISCQLFTSGDDVPVVDAGAVTGPIPVSDILP
jgi:hypothetical protein